LVARPVGAIPQARIKERRTMTTKQTPTLEQLERDLLQRTESLHRRLTAPEGSMEASPPPNTPEKRAAALAKGVRKLERAAYLARTARPAALPLARELLRIAQSITRYGPDVQKGDLHSVVADAIALEAETGVPVARRLAEAVAQFERLFKPRGLSPQQFVRQMLLRRQLRAQLSEMREKRRLG
jgi:hypothetical protein